MRRKTFDRWFGEEFEAAHATFEELQNPWPGYFMPIAYRPLYLTKAKHDNPVFAVPLDHTRDITALRVQCAALETRLAQLECPKHSYKSDTCVKCGKERD